MAFDLDMADVGAAELVAAADDVDVAAALEAPDDEADFVPDEQPVRARAVTAAAAAHG